MNRNVKTRILVATVNYRRPEDTVSCMLSLARMDLGGAQLRVVVCDNSPTETRDAIAAGLCRAEGWLKEAVNVGSVYRPSAIDMRVMIFNSPENKGFAGGNNACIEAGKQAFGEFDFLWLLNNDTEVDRDCLQNLLKPFGYGDNIGACGCTMIYYHDKATVQALGGSTYRPWAGTMREIGNGSHWPQSVDERAICRKMSYICGASMLVSAAFLRDVGPMNEDYFLFFEEIDWCERGRRKGYKYAYASEAIVYHKEGAAIGTGTGARRSLLAEYYGMRNRLLVTWRFFPWAFPTVWLIGWLQVARRALQRRPANAWLMAKVLCGLGKRPV